jgi:hypothetical protein
MGRGSDPVPSAHAQAYDDDEFGPDDLSAEERPILLADIDRSLGESAVLERTRGASPIRVWREELTLALESLAYARAVLAADVAILRHTLAGGADQQAIVDDLPAVMAAHSGGDEWSDSPEAHDPGRLELDLGVFVRSDRLVAGHEEMALVDLSSSEDVELLLGELERELAQLTERQHAVELRLQQIRAAIVRQYQEGAAPTRGWPG